MMEKTFNYDFMTMLEEAQDKLTRQFASMSALREHGKLILGSSSVIVSLFSLFKISSTSVKPEFTLAYTLLIFLMALFYFLLMYFSMKSVLPYPLEHAIDPTWETYATEFKEETDRTILEKRVYAYLAAIKNNESTLIKQYEISKKLNWYMTALILTIIVVAFFIPFMQA
jgi:hypothetical protein